MTAVNSSSTASDYADLVRELHQAAEEHDRGHGPLHAVAANAIDHLMTLIKLMQPGTVAQAEQAPAVAVADRLLQMAENMGGPHAPELRALAKRLCPKAFTVPSTDRAAPKPEPTRWPTKGDWMTFLGQNGYDFEREAALKIFNIGQKYLVEDCNVGNWEHSVKFSGLDGWHNGVMFERTPKLPSTNGNTP